MSGPRPKPTYIRKKEGNPGRVKINENEPIPPSERLSCPEWLNDVGKIEWKRIIEMFNQMEANGQRVITEADQSILAAYCQAYSDLVEAIKKINEVKFKVGNFEFRGNIIVFKRDDNSIYMQVSPYETIKNKAIQIMLKCASELGFTPASRTKIQVIPIGKNDSESERLFG